MKDELPTAFLRPRAGVIVRGEDRQPLPEEGAERPLTNWWMRRINDGDVEKVADKPTKRRRAKSEATRAQE